MSEAPARNNLCVGRDRAGFRVSLVGWGIHIPGFDPSEVTGQGDSLPRCTPERAHEILGRKGLLGKEPATRLALCAVHQALGSPPRDWAPGGAVDPRTAVVVSSNLGNVATVHEIARLAHEGRCGRSVRWTHQMRRVM